MHQRQDVRCDTCLYYDVLEEQPDRGVCRFHAPFPVGAILSPWPVVGRADWCGRWRRAPNIPGPAETVELIAGPVSPA